MTEPARSKPAIPRWGFPHPSQRMPVLADEMVATSQPLAAQAGLDTLARGGTAVDAAIAAAAALTVTEPTGNGLGSDAFALVWDGQALHGLNASGRAPAGIDVERLRARTAMPTHGWDAVTVPGAVSAWTALHERFGRLDLADLVEPAARMAEHGWRVGPITAALWARAPEQIRQALTDAGQPELFDDFAAAFLPTGQPPATGDRVALPAQAATLRAIGATAGAAFYRGEIAERIHAAASAAGAALTGEDLAAHTADWVEPMSLTVDELEAELVELPPNGQGVAALAALGTLARTPGIVLPPDDPEGLHWQIEAMKAAFADAHAHVADPSSMTVAPEALLDPAHLDQRAAEIQGHHAATPQPAPLPRGGTVYLATADAQGRMVSFIQSNYMGFGSGVVVPGTGISLHNRAAGFSTDASHPNAVTAAARPFHTIIPAFARRNGVPWLAYGVMGGHMQPQGHLQVLLRAARGANAQAALDAPRWRVDEGRRVSLEAGVADALVAALAARGHDVRRDSPAVTGAGVTGSMFGFGGGQAIERLPGGGWLGGSDHRKDGQAVGR